MLTTSIGKWSLILILGLPLITIILGEIVERLNKKSNPLANCFHSLRFLLVPCVAILILFRKVFEVSENSKYLQTIETLFWLIVIYTVLDFFNVIFTCTVKKYSWQIAIPNLFFHTARAVMVLGATAQILSSVWQIDLSQLITALGVGSLVIALALQDTLSNLVSGFLLLFESPFKVGDWILVQGMEGEVIEINWRAVRLKTRDRDIVVIPNGILGKDIINNFTLIDPIHAEKALVQFSYDDPPNYVKDILKQIALKVEGILRDPEPEIRTKSYNDCSISYEIKFYTKNYRQVEDIHNHLMSNIYYTAKRQGLTIPLPIQLQYNVPYDKVAKEQALLFETISNYLRSLPYFYFLNDDEIPKLAHQATILNYGMGETIIESGKPASGFYLIMRGEVKLWLNDIEGDEQEIIRLSTGDIFGETVFLQGEPSYFYVTVLKDAQVIMIEADIALNLIMTHPKLALEINYLIEERQKAVRVAKSSPQNEIFRNGKLSVDL